MSPTSQQSRQTSYSARHDHRDPTGPTVTNNNYSSLNTNGAKLGSTTNIALDAALRPPPRISSAYRRTLESHGSSQSGCIDLDTFDVPCPPSAPFPSPRALRFTHSDGFPVTPSVTEKDGSSSGAHGRKKSGSSGLTYPSTSSATSYLSSTVPDLGEVDLSDGKNKERPQRFKAVIHFKRRDPDSGRLRQGGGATSRPLRSRNEENDGGS